MSQVDILLNRYDCCAKSLPHLSLLVITPRSAWAAPRLLQAVATSSAADSGRGGPRRARLPVAVISPRGSLAFAASRRHPWMKRQCSLPAIACVLHDYVVYDNAKRCRSTPAPTSMGDRTRHLRGFSAGCQHWPRPEYGPLPSPPVLLVSPATGSQDSGPETLTLGTPPPLPEGTYLRNVQPTHPSRPAPWLAGGPTEAISPSTLGLHAPATPASQWPASDTWTGL